ncbi:MAG: hypothetical protein Q9M94_05440 [Candidatus Gracilibacteria bacterium]|nr:hypothetical protein [Candidatus Gracilibacteria bacterium]
MNHTITTTLGVQYFSFLNEESKEKKITKKSIIEGSFRDSRKNTI